MKPLCMALVLALLSGCTRGNSKGPCIGLADDKAPGVQYELSYWNLTMAALFSETLIVPIVVAAYQLKCPVEP